MREPMYGVADAALSELRRHDPRVHAQGCVQHLIDEVESRLADLVATE